MKTTTEGKALIKSYEGLSLKAFFDVTGYAIGYGQHTYSNGVTVKKTDKITKEFANSDFDKYIGNFEKKVAAYITSNLTDNQFSALVSYAYNRGEGAFKNSNLLKMVNKNPNDSAIPKQFEIEWGTSTKFKTSLIKRRKAEAEFYRKGTYPPKGNFITDFFSNSTYLIITAIFGLGTYWVVKMGGKYVIQKLISKLIK